MKAVNLVPADSRRGRGGASTGLQVPTYALLGVLAAALVMVTVYVLTNNTIADRTAKLASLQTEVAQEQAAASQLGAYAQLDQVAQTRVQTVEQIAAARFDWNGALSELAEVVPANTSLQSLSGSVVPGTGGGSSSGSSAGGTSLRGAITAPAIELNGCTASQDDVARLMSRLRLIQNVTRVSLGNSQESDAVQASAPSAGGGPSSSSGCGTGKPTFDLVVFFKPVPGAGSSGYTTQTSGTASTTGGTK